VKLNFVDILSVILHSGSYLNFINKDLQYSSQEFFGGLMTQVVDDKTAHDAIKTIIDQGEGSVGVEDAHYQMFLELLQKRTDWECYPVPCSPHAKDFEKTPFVHRVRSPALLRVLVIVNFFN